MLNRSKFWRNIRRGFVGGVVLVCSSGFITPALAQLPTPMVGKNVMVTELVWDRSDVGGISMSHLMQLTTHLHTRDMSILR